MPRPNKNSKEKSKKISPEKKPSKTKEAPKSKSKGKKKVETEEIIPIIEEIKANTKSKSKTKEVKVKTAKNVKKEENLLSKKREKPMKAAVAKEPLKKLKEAANPKASFSKSKGAKNIKCVQPEVDEKKPKSGYYVMNKFTKLFDEDCKDFLLGKCQNNYCKYIHNFSKLWKDKINEEFARRYYTFHQDFQVLAPYERKLFGKANLDLMFIMDCTGSMSSWIFQCQKELGNIIDFIKEANPYSEVNVGFVGYRDHCDGENRLTHHPFTTDVEIVKTFINKTSASGGGDEPEDLAGGLDLALKQDWKSKAKYAIIVSDAPCHGRQFHSCMDDYPTGCPKGLKMEDLVSEFAKRDIILSAIEINNKTEQMYQLLNKPYLEIAKRAIKVDKLGNNTAHFGFVVGFGASATLNSVTMGNISLKDFLNEIKKETVDAESLPDNKPSKSKAKNTVNNDNKLEGIPHKTQLQEFMERINTVMGQVDDLNNDEPEDRNPQEPEPNPQEVILPNLKEDDNPKSLFGIKVKETKLDYKISDKEIPKPKDWNNLSEYKFNSICHSFNIPKNRNTFINWKSPIIKPSNIKCQVTLSNTPFAEGAMRYAFYMKDITLNQKLVGKLNKTIKQSENNLNHLSKDILSLTICRHIAYDFDDRILNILPDTRLLINFVHAYIYELIDYSNRSAAEHAILPSHQQFISVENYIEGEYSKYNNNSGWTNDCLNETSLIAQAFSHFSWQITRGYLMIVDLQGVGNILTDPQIHCMDPKKFGKGNLGYVGMMKFFMSHICNSYCKHLELVHPRNKINVDQNYEFFVDKYVPPEDKMINKLCDLCKVSFVTSAKDLYDKKKKCWDSFCQDCEAKRKAAFTTSQCQKCVKSFVSSAYIFQMKREEFPKFCQKCKIDLAISENEGLSLVNED